MSRSGPRLRALVALACLAAGAGFPSAARSERGVPALPGESRCPTPLVDRAPPARPWTEQERWTWERICLGEVADLAQKYGGSKKPDEAEHWPARRVLTADFLETILLHEPYRGAIGRQGVRIDGAAFREVVDLSHAALTHTIGLHRCRFADGLRLFHARAAKLLSFIGSRVNGMLNMEALKVDGSLYLADGARFDRIDLRSADIGGVVVFNDAEVQGGLNMDKIRVASSLFMDGNARRATFAEFGAVNLVGARVGGQLSMNHAKVKAVVLMDSLEVKGSLLMQDGSEFAEVLLGGAKIGGQVAMTGSKFAGRLDMENLTVAYSLLMGGQGGGGSVAEFGKISLNGAKIGSQLDMTQSKFGGPIVMDGVEVRGDLLMRYGAFANPVFMVYSRVGSNLDLSGAQLGVLDLTGTSIRGNLALGGSGHPPVQWRENGRLILRIASVGKIHDLAASWPDGLELDLDGLTYTQLGATREGLQTAEMASRPVRWFVDWLARDKTYSPQPYEQLATVLRQMGHEEKANDILFHNRLRAMRESKAHWSDKIWQGAMLAFIGFGHRPYYALPWIVLFVVVGALVARRTPEGRGAGMRFGLAYSLDKLLPIIRLRDAHYAMDFAGGWRPARYYFYFHQMMGYVLASFLIAGLSGLTK